MTRIAAIVPVGSLEGAKSRLGEQLDAEERLDLVERVLAPTVVAALAVDRLADVLVVSPDRHVLDRAADLGARTLRQRSRGLNLGLREAPADVVAGGAGAVPGGGAPAPRRSPPTPPPLVAPAEIDRVIERIADTERIVVLVTDRH